MRLLFTGEAEMTLRHRTFAPGEVTTFDMDDEADAALFDKVSRLAMFEPVAGEQPKRRGRPRKVSTDAQDEA